MKLVLERLAWLAVGVCGGVLGVKYLGPDTGPPASRDPKTRPASAPAPASARTPLPPRSDTYDVLGWRGGISGPIVRYNDKLYRGGQITREAGVAALKQWGIRTIVSITPDNQERAWARRHGLDLVEVPFSAKTGLSVETVRAFLQALRDAKGRVYLHCKGGCHRAGALGVAYRMHVENWTYDRAVVEFALLGGDVPKYRKLLAAARSARAPTSLPSRGRP